MFYFKRFAVSHDKSSMKVGVDAVLLGAWVGEKATRILDVGTGCGVIALMTAQRFPEALIDAIDIDESSVNEANLNFKNSPWSRRMTVCVSEFPKRFEIINEKYDLIVSNPPFFQSGISQPSTPRERARHMDKLSVFTLLEFSPKILKEDGILAMIFPSEFEEKVIETASHYSLFPKRICKIKNREGKSEKRVMIELQKKVNLELKCEVLTLFNNGYPSEAYKHLCQDFYLKF